MKKLDLALLKRGQMTLRALNHKLRLSLLNTIRNYGEIKVTDLYVEHRLEQSGVSQHLAILRKANIVNTTRDGKCIYYSVNEDRIKDILKITSQY